VVESAHGMPALFIRFSQSKISFLQYYGIKDFFAIGAFALLLIFVTVFTPNYMGHPDNYIPANPMVTPPHIVPE